VTYRLLTGQGASRSLVAIAEHTEFSGLVPDSGGA
jgi:hypothetical protein